jgi:N-sulfoglucosamine sulfohydrolase
MNIFPQRCERDSRYEHILNLAPESTWTKVSGIRESRKEVWDTWVEKAKTDAHAAKIVQLNEHHPQEELYDTQSDRYEFNNLATDPTMQPVLLKMRRQLAQWLTEQGEAHHPY